MDINKTDIRYTITTTAIATGVGRIGAKSFAWHEEPEGDDPTASVLFEQIEDDGTVSDSYAIEGDDWRTLEDSGELDKVLTWVRRGCVLESAVDAAIQECDPDGFDGAYEDRIDDLIAERDALRAELDELKAATAPRPAVFLAHWDVKREEGCEPFATRAAAVDAVLGWANDYGWIVDEYEHPGEDDPSDEERAALAQAEARAELEKTGELHNRGETCFYRIEETTVQR